MQIKYLLFSLFSAVASGSAYAQTSSAETNTLEVGRTSVKKDNFRQNKLREYHSALGAEYGFGWTPSDAPFFKEGLNNEGKVIRNVNSFYLKYAIVPKSGSWEREMYGLHYEGIGVGYNTFLAKEALGDPLSLFLFQGGTIVQILPRFSLDYEWKFGIATGWVPYDAETNPNNGFIGSRTTALISFGANLNYEVIRNIRLKAGIAFNHYSNGNTKLPNGGINTAMPYVGLVYDFNSRRRRLTDRVVREKYTPGMQYDLMFYGGVRQLVRDDSGMQGTSPFSRRNFLIGGAQFAALYRSGYRLAFGGALDLAFDESAGVAFYKDKGVMVFDPVPARKRIFMGLAARIDYIMPIFTVSGELGYDFFNHAEGYSGFYQTLALKMRIVKRTSLKVAWRIHDLDTSEGVRVGVSVDISKRH